QRDQVQFFRTLLGVQARGKRVKGVGQPSEPGHLVLQRSEDLSVRDDDALAEPLQVAVEVGEWRSELVREVEDEVAAQSLLILEARSHLVEGVRYRRQLRRRGSPHAGVISPGGDSAGRARQFVQRPLDYVSADDGQTQ